jgi:hypothetical protein
VMSCLVDERGNHPAVDHPLPRHAERSDGVHSASSGLR